MMNNLNNEHNASPNDFLELLRTGFTLMSELFSFLKQALLKKSLIIIFFTVTGLVLGYLKQYVSKPVYKGSMQVTQNDVSKAIFTKKIQTIGNLLETKSYNVVARKLFIPQEVASNLCNISVISLDHDTANVGSFLITIESNDNQNGDTLQAGILKYLNSFEYVNTLKKIQRELYREKIIFIDKQLAQLDSFKVIYAKSMSHVNVGSVNLMMNQNDMSDLFKQSADLIKEKQQLTENLNGHENIVYVMDDLSISEKPNRGSIASNILKFVAFSFLIGYVIAMLSLLNDKLRVNTPAN